MTHRSPLHPYHPSTGPSAWGGPRAAFRHSPVHIPVRFESRIEGCRCGAPPRDLGLGDPGLVEGRQSQLPASRCKNWRGSRHRHQRQHTCNQAAVEIAPASLSTITGDSKYSMEGSAPRRSRIPARQAAS